MSSLAATGHLAPLASDSTGSSNTCFPERTFIQSPSKTCLKAPPLSNVFYGLLLRQIFEINAAHMGNIPSGVLDYTNQTLPIQGLLFLLSKLLMSLLGGQRRKNKNSFISLLQMLTSSNSPPVKYIPPAQAKAHRGPKATEASY